MILLFSFGAGLFGFAGLYYATSTTKFPGASLNRFTLPNATKDRKAALGGMLGFIIGVILFYGSGYQAVGSLMFAGMGAGSVLVFTNMKQRYVENQRRKECIMLFNAFAIFLPAGISIPQVLNSAKEFSPHLEHALNKSLAAWHSSSVEALKILRKEINLPEGEILVSLLLQISQAGAKNLHSIIQNESRRLDDRRRAMDRVRITRKPIILNIYRFLPLVVLLGLGGGFLVTYAFAQLDQII